MSAVLLVVMALAAYRLWHLVAEDTIIERPRAWLVKRSAKLSDFITCPWCAGFWISCGVVAVTAQLVSVPLPALQAAAVSGLVGLIAEIA